MPVGLWFISYDNQNIIQRWATYILIKKSKAVRNLHIPAVEGVEPIVRGIYYLGKDQVIICFLDLRMGIV